MASPNSQLWLELREWIDQREAIESKNKSSTLSIDQKKAIRELLDSKAMQTESVPFEMDNRNYVGELNELLAKKRLGEVCFSDGVMANTRLPNAPLNWSITCTLPWCNETFPKAGYGAKEGEQPPSFQSKKVAKQYAAKYALAFVLTGPAPRSQTPEPAEGSLSDVRKRSIDEISPHQALVSPTRRPIPRAADPRHQVNTICTRMKIQIPRYIVTRSSTDDDALNYYDGKVVWPQGITQPDEVIAVKDSMFFDAIEVEQYLARRALEWLQKEEEQRRDTFARLKNSLGLEGKASGEMETK